jgi:hypothetical protein
MASTNYQENYGTLTEASPRPSNGFLLENGSDFLTTEDGDFIVQE